MARIPGPQDFARVQPPSPVERTPDTSQAEFTQSLGDAAIQLGGVLKERRQKTVDVGYKSFFSANAKAAFQETYDRVLKEVPETGAGFTQKLETEFAKTRQALMQQAEESGYDPSQSARLTVESSLSGLSGQFLANAVAFENNQAIKVVNRDVNTAVERVADNAFNSPGDFETHLEELDVLLESLEGTQFAGDIAESRQTARANIAISAIRGRIANDPPTAYNELENGKYDQFLSVDEKVTFISKALSGIESREKSISTAIKNAQDQNETLFTQQFFDPEASDPTDIELVQALGRGDISREGFNRLRGYVNTDFAEESDAGTRLGLLQLAQEGNRNIPSMVARAVQEGRLTQDHAASIMSTNRTALRSGSVMSDPVVKQQRRRVDQVVGGVRGPLAVLDTAESARVANAIQEFDERVMAGEDATEVAENVIERFRSVPPSPTEFATPAYLVGQRSKPDIEATRAATADAFESGEITREEYAQELRNLEDIEDALRAQEEMRRGR